MAEMFKEWVDEHPNFELMAPVHLSLVCFRLNDGRDEEALNSLNKELIERINKTGKILLTQTTLKGKFVLRMAIAARTTKEDHVRQAWQIIRDTADEIHD
jgi:aromatic-L-amino-acid decarboxylase